MNRSLRKTNLADGEKLARRLFVSLALSTTFVAAPLAAQVWETRNQLLTSDGGPIPSASFGAALASGDFDGNGATDLAIGEPDADTLSYVGAGQVEIFLSGASGLHAGPVAPIEGFEDHLRVGDVLAAGDFDGDGSDELVVGAPYATNPGAPAIEAGGEVRVYHVDSAPATIAGDFTQDSPGVPGVAEPFDHFGSKFAVGDFNGDGDDDLAIGAYTEDVGSVQGAGAVTILYGGPTGLTSSGSQIFYRSGGGLNGSAETDANLGAALAAGDFNGDGDDDLAIGVPGAGVGRGGIAVLLGSIDGLVTTGQQAFGPDDVGIAQGGQFGASLGAGDLNRTTTCLIGGFCTDDLVVGMPYATVSYGGGDVGAAGAVVALYGNTATALSTTGAVELTQASFDPLHNTAPESSDRFGTSVLVGQLGGSGAADIAVGTWYEALEGVGDAGCVHLLLGGSPLASGFAQYFTERPELHTSPAFAEDVFGVSLAAGDFDHDGWRDLAIGVPGRDFPAADGAGAVEILYGAEFADSFGAGNESAWSSHVP